jgi:hypothetical protein
MRTVSLLLVLAASGAAQTETANWIAFGAGASLRAEHGVMSMQYSPGAKGPSAAALPTPGGLAGMRRIRLRVRSDYDTAFALMLSEKQPGGGNYSAIFWSPANTWQQIEFAPSDFAVGDGPNDPVDADGKLDLDAVQNIGLFDLTQMFAQAPPSEAPLVINRPTGAHTVEVEKFEVVTTGEPVSAGAIDRFERDFVQWFSPGGMKLRISASENPLRTRALAATYQQVEGQVPVLVRRLTNFDLSKAGRIAFDVASERESTVVLAFEQKNGARYSLQIFPPGGREVFHVDLKLTDFEGPGELKPALLKTLSIADITASAGGAEGSNTLWIGRVEMH